MAPQEQPPLSRALSDVLTGAYRENRLKQEAVAKNAGMSLVTLQKKLAAKAPITATDLVVLATAMGEDPKEILERAIKKIGGLENLMPMSEASPTNVTRLHPRDMSPDQLENLKTPMAAHPRDAESDATEDD